ncbi:MAG: hypothetical protein QM704_27560 [Anaeromyxobacteraceae bacterium]
MSAGPLLSVLEPDARADALRFAEALEALPGSACLLGPGGEILYVNDGWDRFARENGGAPGALGEHLLGKRYASYVGGREPRSFFEGLWLRVVGGQPVSYRDGCDSALVHRKVFTSFTPVRLGASFGALVVHALDGADVAPPLREPSGARPEASWTR